MGGHEQNIGKKRKTAVIAYIITRRDGGKLTGIFNSRVTNSTSLESCYPY